MCHTEPGAESGWRLKVQRGGGAGTQFLMYFFTNSKNCFGLIIGNIFFIILLWSTG